jgi:hypothetical protein
MSICQLSFLLLVGEACQPSELPPIATPAVSSQPERELAGTEFDTADLRAAEALLEELACEHEKRTGVPKNGRLSSTGGLNHESQRGRSLRHAHVISNQDFQVSSDPLCRCEVYRVERSEYSRVERRRTIQQRIVHAYEMNPVKDQSRSAYGCGSEVTNGAGHFGSCQRARDAIVMAPQEA